MGALTMRPGRPLAVALAISLSIPCFQLKAQGPVTTDPVVQRVCTDSDPAGPVASWGSLFDCVVSSAAAHGQDADPFALVERMLDVRAEDIPRDVALYWQAELAFVRGDDRQHLALLASSFEAGNAEAAYDLYKATGDRALFEKAVERGSPRAIEIDVQGKLASPDPDVVVRGILELEQLAGAGNVQPIDQLARHVAKLPQERQAFWRLAFFLGGFQTNGGYVPPTTADWPDICKASRRYPRVLALTPSWTNMDASQQAVAIEYLVHCGSPARVED